MSEFNDEIRVDAEELLELVVAVFERCGMSQADATLLADSLVDADLCGTHSHGVIRVPEYAEKLTTQGVNPTAKPEIVRAGPSFVIVDGRNSMGQIGTALAMQEVIYPAVQSQLPPTKYLPPDQPNPQPNRQMIQRHHKTASEPPSR